LSFYERREVKDLLAYLRLVQNPADDAAFRRVLNVPPRGLGDKALQDLERLAAERASSLGDAMAAVLDETLLAPRSREALRRFHGLLETLRADAARLSIRGLLERALALTGYSAALAEENSQEAEDRLQNLAELLQAAADFEARARHEGADPEDAATGLPAFLDRMALLSDVDKAQGDAPVLLLTLHSAKGLEFDTVFLVGLEEGLLPHARSLLDADGIEEERRLGYVGMTRARERLSLSWARSRGVFGQRRLQERSRFLDEIPGELLETSGSTGDTDRSWRDDVPAWSRRSRGPWRPRAASSEGPRAVPAPTGAAGSFRPGARVRHPLFGVGTVLRSEGAGDDLKLTVSFPAVGAKRLVARFAGLEPV
jgi:DNA helicase-2/ATP-dependent DNA helicase PcrA